MDNKSWPTRNKKSTMMRWERLRIVSSHKNRLLSLQQKLGKSQKHDWNKLGEKNEIFLESWLISILNDLLKTFNGEYEKELRIFLDSINKMQFANNDNNKGQKNDNKKQHK